jgi:hypothetical protein
MNMPTSITINFAAEKLAEDMQQLCRSHLQQNFANYATLSMGDTPAADDFGNAAGAEITVSQAPTLKKGELYAGIILGKDGAANHHLILLPGQKEDINWADAGKWAKKIGGELPTRREQALLYANLKEAFEERWYWSCEQHAGNADYAWYQDFEDGNQSHDHKDYELRARAVRRLAI